MSGLWVWTLVVLLQGDVEVSSMVVPGFPSQVACEVAAQTIVPVSYEKPVWKWWCLQTVRQ